MKLGENGTFEKCWIFMISGKKEDSQNPAAYSLLYHCAHSSQNHIPTNQNQSKNNSNHVRRACKSCENPATSYEEPPKSGGTDDFNPDSPLLLQNGHLNSEYGLVKPPLDQNNRLDFNLDSGEGQKTTTHVNDFPKRPT